MARDIKANLSKWINENRWIPGKFNWQEGFGAFSYSKSQIDSVIKYILNQPEHHKKTTFKDEYINFLKKFEIEYNEKYLFKWNDKCIAPNGAKYVFFLYIYATMLQRFCSYGATRN